MPGNRCYVPEELGETFYITTIAAAAAADWVYTVPAGYEYEVTAVWMRFACDANVANRLPMFVMWPVVDGIDISRQRFPIQTAGVTLLYSLWRGNRRVATAGINAVMTEALPSGRITAGDQFGSATTAIQVGDQWNNIRVLVRRWRI